MGLIATVRADIDGYSPQLDMLYYTFVTSLGAFDKPRLIGWKSYVYRR